MRAVIALAAIAACVGMMTAQEAGGIAGVVTDGGTGTPIVGARVLVRGDSGQAGQARTNERGQYEIGHLRAGCYRVAAWAAGYKPSKYAERVLVRAGQITRGIDFSLLPKPQHRDGAISGSVLDRVTGRTIAGAVVVAGDGNCRGQARTDAHGNYVIRGLKPGKYGVKAGAKGYATAGFPGRVPVRAGQMTGNVDFSLKPEPKRGVIAGCVRDARTHEPIPGALVEAHGEQGAGRATTDRHGRYSVKLDPGSYRVAARARGYRAEVFPMPVPVRAGQATKDINFRLHQDRLDSD